MGEGKSVERWDEWTADMQARHGNGNGHGKSLAIEAQRLLPTPTAQDSAASGGSTPSDVTLTDAAVRTELGSRPNPRLLPTPRSSADRTSRASLTREGHWSAPALGQAVELASGILPREFESWSEVQGVQVTTWGDYAPAIARWEAILERAAPPPTAPGPKGAPRLSPRFTEWLMGLPDGWVTDVPGVTRNEALRLCGNGVVPRQAEAALREMLGWEAAA